MAIKDVEKFVTGDVRLTAPVLGHGSLDAMRARRRRGVGKAAYLESQWRRRADSDVNPLRPSSSGLNGGVLVLTAADIVLLATHTGLIHVRAHEEVHRVGLDQLDTAEFDQPGNRLVLRWQDEGRWEFDVQRRFHADAELFARALPR